MLGGGEQLVLIQSGRVTCWPSLGYGEFGAPVELGGVPRFDDVPDQAVFLADLTGTGPADLVLLRPGRVDVYLNQGGNAFSPVQVSVTTPVATPGTLAVGEVTTDGRRSLVFSTGGQQPRHYALTFGAGTQPFRLTEFDAGRGARSWLSYSTSARMRLRDEARGEPWHVDMPFSVPVVETITTDDEIAAVRTTTRLSYRNGYFDAHERVFTGFARVDKVDSEEILPTAPSPVEPPKAAVAPTLTRSWYHVGQFAVAGFDRALEREYFAGDPDAYPMPGPTLDWDGLTPDADLLRQGHLALAGAYRRVEVYDADRPDVPYRVEQSEQTVRLLAPPTEEAAAFLVHERESIQSNYERVANDPAVRHTFTLEVDEFGNVTRDCTVHYRRRGAGAVPGQDQAVVVARLRDYLPARDEPDLLLHGFNRLDRNYSVTGIERPSVLGLYYHEGQIAGQVTRALRGDAPAAAELMAAERTSYDGADGGQAPPQPLAAPPRVRRRDAAAFTGAHISELLAGVVLPLPVEQFLIERGGYAYDADTDLWWQVGESVSYRAELFWQPTTLSDPVAAIDPADGSAWEFFYDRTAMAVVGMTLKANAGGLAELRTTIEMTDYQTLLPQRARDPNGVVSEVLYDPLGRIFATAFRGRVWVDGGTRETGFPPLPADDPAAWPQPRDVAELAADPARFLGAAASFVFYDDHGWRRGGVPALSAAVAAADYPAGPDPRAAGAPLMTVAYLDGDSQPVQTSIRVDVGDPVPAAFRWSVAARARYSGAGLPLQRYLPFFTDSPGFVTQAELDTTGVGPTSGYDALGREVRTDVPRGSFPSAFYATTHYLPWSVTTADVDDTVTSSAYYRYYIDGGHDLPPHEREALLSASAFDGTPTTRHLGVLGGTVALDERLTRHDQLTSRFRYDAVGRLVSAAEPRQAAAGRVNLTLRYGLAAEPLQVTSVDSGASITLNDVTGARLLAVDGRGTTLLFEHDAWHRITALMVTEPPAASDRAADGPGAAGGTAVIAERYLYGDTLDPAGATIYPNPAERGLLGRVCVSYDEAGRHEISAYALTGQPLATVDSFAAAITADPDWLADAWTTWAELFARFARQLEPTDFGSTAWYDPAGKVLTVTDPGGNTVAWHYDPAGGVSGIDLAVGACPAEPYATGVTYDAARQRRSTGYAASGREVIRREFDYDPASLMLTSVRGIAVADGRVLQDLSYVYDPAGNVTFVSDPAAPRSAGSPATPGAASADLSYGYDALYRLTSAAGLRHRLFQRC